MDDKERALADALLAVQNQGTRLVSAQDAARVIIADLERHGFAVVRQDNPLDVEGL